MKILAWFFATVIAGLNVYFVVNSAIDFFAISEFTRFVLATIFIPLSMGLVGLLVYLIFQYVHPAGKNLREKNASKFFNGFLATFLLLVFQQTLAFLAMKERNSRN
jgi:hypothetical protein